ncbi:MAG: hypothetical protein RMJ82_13625, partial [Gemmatales bacterium]|nr:hypothetical protein [Gemmatales bacterium]
GCHDKTGLGSVARENLALDRSVRLSRRLQPPPLSSLAGNTRQLIAPSAALDAMTRLALVRLRGKTWRWIAPSGSAAGSNHHPSVRLRGTSGSWSHRFAQRRRHQSARASALARDF